MKVNVAILAGGFGTRLNSVVSDLPKVLAPVHGRPFLHFLLDDLLEVGFEEVTLLVGYRAQQIRTTIGDSYRSLRIRYSQENQPLGTGGSVRLALSNFDQSTLLLLNGDSYTNVDYSQFVHFHQQHALDMSMALVKVPNVSRYGRVTLNEANRVEWFEEKGLSAGSGFINAGVYLLSHNLFNVLPVGASSSLEHDLLPGWVARRLVGGWPGATCFLDIGTPDSYAQAESFFAALPVAASHLIG